MLRAQSQGLLSSVADSRYYGHYQVWHLYNSIKKIDFFLGKFFLPLLGRGQEKLPFTFNIICGKLTPHVYSNRSMT